MSSDARFWKRRLRWRLRGAWQWPAFAALTLVDGLILHLLPPAGWEVDVIFGVIVASFANLLLVGLVAPWIARRLRERDRRARPTNGAGALPAEVVLDRTATALLGAGAVALLVAGLASQPLVVSETEATEENAGAVQDYVLANGSEEVRRNLETANTIRLGEGYFRTCVALDDRTRAFCMFVDTNAEPPKVTEDPNPVPNAEFPGGRGNP